MMKLKIIDTSGGHYGIVLETRIRKESDLLFMENVPRDGPSFLRRYLRRTVFFFSCEQSKQNKLTQEQGTAGCSL